MFTKIRVGLVAASSSLAMLAAVAPSAHAGLLSLAPGGCGQTETQPFAQFGDTNSYVLMPGGNFEQGASGWSLHGGAAVVPGNESYNASGGGAYSLSLPAGSSATSPVACTGIDHPSARMFVRNTGSPSSALNVWATYTPILGLIPMRFYLGQVSGSASWAPSSYLVMGLLRNTLGSLNLGESTVSLSFAPADSSGSWQVDDVFLDPFCRA
jgi:hypothetical protein